MSRNQPLDGGPDFLAGTTAKWIYSGCTAASTYSLMRKLTPEEIATHRIPRENISRSDRLPIYGLLDNIRSLYNVGSIFRTSDGAMVRKLYLCGYTPRPPRAEIEKTSLGATASVPWEYVPNPLEAMALARSEGATICVLEQTTRSIPYCEIRKSQFPVCLVAGNEISGVSQEIIQASDIAIEIPMYGTKQSLNVAVAYGIALFELVRVLKTG